MWFGRGRRMGIVRIVVWRLRRFSVARIGHCEHCGVVKIYSVAPRAC